MALKADFHLHIKGDPEDLIRYDADALFARLASLGYDVAAITPHNTFIFDNELSEKAASKGILLIPATEATVENCHIVILNCGQDASKIKKFSELAAYKKSNPEVFVFAPHPFYPGRHSIGRKLLEKHADIFDALEYAHYYLPCFNYFNKLAVDFAAKNAKILLANSDAHALYQLGKNYNLVESEKKRDSVINALRKGATMIESSPPSLLEFLKTSFAVLTNMNL
jgi:predicted metal-dependent phosphoesterase TrpH